MSDKKTTFNEFKQKVTEIADHYEEVETLSFTAKLKNGTRFNFLYDAESFDNPQKTKRHYRPLSVFNAVTDIVAALAAIAFIALTATKGRLHDISLALTLNTFIFYMTYFVFSSVCHLFDGEARAVKPLFVIRFALSLIPVTLTVMTLFFLQDASRVFPVLSIAFAALSCFLISFGTKAGGRAAYIGYVADAVLVFLLPGSNAYLAGMAIMMIISGLVPMLTPSKWQKSASNGIFILITVSLFFLHLFLL